MSRNNSVIGQPARLLMLRRLDCGTLVRYMFTWFPHAKFSLGDLFSEGPGDLLPLFTSILKCGKLIVYQAAPGINNRASQIVSEITEEELAKRRVPALIAYLNPFRIIEKDHASEPWSASIEQVNESNWDYVALHEIIGGVDVGLESPYHMVIARDGALALPPIPKLRFDQAAVEYFNHCLAALLLGGIYCEAINLDGLAGC